MKKSWSLSNIIRYDNLMNFHSSTNRHILYQVFPRQLFHIWHNLLRLTNRGFYAGTRLPCHLFQLSPVAVGVIWGSSKADWQKAGNDQLCQKNGGRKPVQWLAHFPYSVLTFHSQELRSPWLQMF